MKRISCLLLLLVPLTQAVFCKQTESSRQIFSHGFLRNFNLKMDIQPATTTNPFFFLKFKKKRQHTAEAENINLEKGTQRLKSVAVRVKNKYKKGSRAFLESLTFMSISAALYWWRWGLWAEDWQYSFSWDEQKIRFFTLEATKFDSNSFMTNFSHGPNGAIFYNFARTNNLGLGESLLYSIISSLFWEYLVEFKEIVSINDNIFNTFVGFSIGEPLYQMAFYLSSQDSASCKILGIIVNPIMALNNWLDKRRNKKNPRNIEHYQHKGSIFFGTVIGSSSGENPSFNHFQLGAESRLLSIPDYDNPGKSVGKLGETFFSEIFADMMVGSESIEEFNIYSMATLFGLFKKNLKKNSGQSEKLSGYHYFLALGSAFEMFRKRSPAPYDTITSGSSHSERIAVTLPTEFSDKMAIINILGPVFQFGCRTGNTSIQLNIQSYFDFALVNSFALQDYSAISSLYGIKSTLAKFGYYYAYGFTLASEISISHGNLNADGKIKYHQFESIEGLDRFQDSIIDDFHRHDSRFQYQIGLIFRIPQTPIALMLSHEKIFRKGSLKDIDHSETEDRIYFQIKLLFF
jgi:hypothetical protein